jgi:hypothetical protein
MKGSNEPEFFARLPNGLSLRMPSGISSSRVQFSTPTTIAAPSATVQPFQVDERLDRCGGPWLAAATHFFREQRHIPVAAVLHTPSAAAKAKGL